MTLSSMFSQSKKEDKEFLLELAEMIELLIKIGTTKSLDLAEKFGDNYIKLQEKINTHDYTKDDEFIEQLNKMQGR